jgi:imidazolonepropionase-like amidohydrolase
MKWLWVLIGIGGVLAVLVVGLLVFYEMTVYRAEPARRGDVAVVGGTVLAADSLGAIPDGVVLVRDGVIVEVGPAGEVDVPARATVVDATGQTVLPGLIDLHVHLGSPDLDARQEPGLTDLPGMVLDALRFAPGHRRAALEHGVTTVRNLGDEQNWITDLRRQVEDGTLEGPRVFVSGPLFTAAGGHPIATFGADPDSDLVRVPATPGEARQMVRELALGDDPVDVIKVVQERGSLDRPLEPITPDVLDAIVAEAHLHGLLVTAHWGTLADLGELLDAGIDGLEHVDSRDLLDGWPDDLLATLIDRDLPITATLAVSEAALPPDVMPEVVAALRHRIGEYHEAGGRIVAGSDAARPGVRFGDGLHRELELLVESGLTPVEALRAATVEAARVLGGDQLGVVAPGYAADLVVVDGDPTADVSAIRDVVMTFRDGRLVVDRRGN